jgi:hypothetical protein
MKEKWLVSLFTSTWAPIVQPQADIGRILQRLYPQDNRKGQKRGIIFARKRFFLPEFFATG